jgi:predicted RNA-binding Zn-ribbon protein involved in translation (DUF1610 family)
MRKINPHTDPSSQSQDEQKSQLPLAERQLIPITNYSLSTVCPACGTDTYRHACKVRCPKCGFAWDCSEL